MRGPNNILANIGIKYCAGFASWYQLLPNHKQKFKTFTHNIDQLCKSIIKYTLVRVTVLMYYFCVRHLHSAKSHSWVLEEFEIRINNYIEVLCAIYMGKIWR